MLIEMRKLILQIIGGILGIYVAVHYIPGVSLKIIPGHSSFFDIALTKDWQLIVLLGSVVGLLNFFVKPILNFITLPLRILTLGIFSFVINIFLVWLVDKFFPELTIKSLISLLETTLIIWLISIIFRRL